MKPSRWRRGGLALTAAALIGLVPACSNSADSEADKRPRPNAPPPSGSVPDPEVVKTSLDRRPTAGLPWLPLSAGQLPRTIPSPDTALPSLLESLPGRAVLVVNPRITALGAPVDSWSDIRLEFFGVDERWTRLSMGDLGLPEDDTWLDTYSAGQLSSDGRWWAGSTRSGIVALNLATGLVRTIPGIGLGVWIPGRHAMLSDHKTVTLPQGTVSSAPYSTAQVGYEPDGTPLSWTRGPKGAAELVEWHGRNPRLRAVVDEVIPPPRRGQFWPVQATRGHIAQASLRSPRQWIGVFDSHTGQPTAALIHKDDSDLSYRAWLNPRTMLIAQTPYFLAWRPATEDLFRVTDARSLHGLWDIDFATTLTVP